MDDRPFPVLWQGDRRVHRALEQFGCPRSVPWGFIAPYEVGANANHGQTLDVLARRGGLAPEEILAAIERTRAGSTRFDVLHLWTQPAEVTVPKLLELLEAYTKGEK